MRVVTKDLVRNRKDFTYVVSQVTFNECPECGEHLYNREAMQQIEAAKDKALKRRRKSA